MSGLRPVLVDKNIKVRSTMAQLIMALASHDYLSLEGGSVLVQFLIDQCNISDEEVAKVRRAHLSMPPPYPPYLPHVCLFCF